MKVKIYALSRMNTRQHPENHRKLHFKNYRLSKELPISFKKTVRDWQVMSMLDKDKKSEKKVTRLDIYLKTL